MAGARRRLFGWSNDTIAGGSPLDELTAGAIPDATQMWPVQEVTVDDNESVLERNDEVTGLRGDVEPEEFREAPTVTVRGRLYPPILKKLIQLATGSTPTATGAAPAAITRRWEPVPYGTLALPAVHLSVVRDDLYEKFAGCQLSRFEVTFPLDDSATFEATFGALYRGEEAAAPPVPDYTFLEPRWAYKLRDAEAMLAGSSTAIEGLREVMLAYDNRHEDPEFWPMRNRLIIPGTGGDRDRILWYPQQRVLGDQQITGRLGFFDAKVQEEQARHLVKARQIVFDVEGPTLATTPVVKQMFRFTGNRMAYTGGGPSALQKEGRITSQYDLGVFVDPVTGKDAAFELTEAA